MTDHNKLSLVLSQFSGLTEEDFKLSEKYWHHASYQKGEFYNEQKAICKYLGFVVQGVFRSYIINEESGEEKNVFLYSANGFVVTFKSFISQIPCDYHTQALADAEVIQIHITDLQNLYRQSHAWEKFGRLIAQEAFNIVMTRVEGFMFKSPEQRYLDLISQHPDIFNNVPLYHISSYLGIQGPSLSRIRKRISER
jgi:CRP-like cAMP-binding protein